MNILFNTHAFRLTFILSEWRRLDRSDRTTRTSICWDRGSFFRTYDCSFCFATGELSVWLGDLALETSFSFNFQEE